MGFFYSGAAWRFFLRLLGGTQVFAGVLTLVATGLSGTLIPAGVAAGLAMVICGWVLLSKRIAPAFLRDPKSGIGGFGALMAAIVLALLGPIAALMIIAPIDRGAAVLPVLPLGLIAVLSAIFVLPLAAMAPFLGRERKRQMAQQAAVRSDPSLLSPAARLFGTLHWLVIRLAGIALLVPVCWISYDFFTGGSAWNLFIFDSRKTGALMIVLPLLVGWMALPIPMSRNLVLHVPLLWKNIIAQVLFLVPLIAGALYWFMPVYLMFVGDPRLAPVAPLLVLALENREALAVLTGAVIAVLAIFAFAFRPRGLPDGGGEEEAPLQPYAASTSATDMPDVPRKKDLRAARLPEPKLQAMGGLMKIYVAADWMVLRLLGAGLLGIGYLLWQMMEAGRVLPQLALTWGFPSNYALVAYATVGTLLAVPYLLPRIIMAPSHVLGGLVKAVLILGAGVVIQPNIPTAIALLTDEMYHATLTTVAPLVFNVVIGIAVTSALAVSFFRQMGKTPKTDYLGKPVIEMSAADLHRLREARMGIN